MHAALKKNRVKTEYFLYLPGVLGRQDYAPWFFEYVQHGMHGIDAQHEFIRDTTGRATYHYGGAGTIEVVSPAGGVRWVI
jgi:hypothetical protein